LQLVDDLGLANFKDFDVRENEGAGNGVIDGITFFHSGYEHGHLTNCPNQTDPYGTPKENRGKT
jgi:hypothetical protein